MTLPVRGVIQQNTTMDALHNLRSEYSGQRLDEDQLPDSPFDLFRAWFREAEEAGEAEPNAMVLSTLRNGRPSSRVVLLKGIDRGGFWFFTNYESAKARELLEAPVAALNFFWPKVHRQVRVEGSVRRLPPEDSDTYFHSRPRGSRIGAWASPQSTVLRSREELEQMVQDAEVRFGEEGEIPRPDGWGGFRVEADRFEFWQGQQSRLHDRIVYRDGHEDRGWVRERLAP